jgi:hypothetical protein
MQMSAEKYKQLKVSVSPELAIAFSKACITADVSMTGVISKFMSEFSSTAMQRKPSPDYTTKRQRRAAINKITKQLEQIMFFEERYRDSIPENLQNSVVFDNAEQFISSLEEAIEILSSI